MIEKVLTAILKVTMACIALFCGYYTLFIGAIIFTDVMKNGL